MPCLTLTSKAACKWACESSLARATHSTRSPSARSLSVGFVSQQAHWWCLRHVAFKPSGPMLCKRPSGRPSGVKKHLQPISTIPRWAHLELAAAGPDDEAAEAPTPGVLELEALAEGPVAPAAIGTPSSTSRSLPDSSATMLWSFSARFCSTSPNSAATAGPSKPEEVRSLRIGNQGDTPNYFFCSTSQNNSNFRKINNRSIIGCLRTPSLLLAT